MSEFPYVDLVFKEPNSGCWLWEHSVNDQGYGILVYVEGRRKIRLRAHRVSYEWHYGTLPETMEVLHKCDTPCCVNPNHLVLGTHAENMRDMLEKRRHSYGEKHTKILLESSPRGQAHWNSHLTPAQAIAIFSDTKSQREIAEAHGVNQSVISKIKAGKSWRHVTRKVQ